MIRNIKIVNLMVQVYSWYITIVKIDKTFDIVFFSLADAFQRILIYLISLSIMKQIESLADV